MASELRFRRGSTAGHAAFTGADGEVSFNTDTNELVTHDGATAGGFPGGGFLASGANAVPRAIRNKLREISVSPEDFRAVADADDGPSIQRAIDAVNTAGGGTVIFTPGKTYYKSQAIDLKDGVRLWCHGRCYVQNTVNALPGFRNNTGARIGITVSGIYCTCAVGVTGTIAWDLSYVSDSHLERLGCDTSNTATTGFLEGIKVYTGAGLGAYRNQVFAPFVRTLANVAAIGLDFSGVGGADEGANGTRVFGGQVRADLGTQAYLNGNNCLLSGVSMEGSPAIGVDVAANTYCTTNVINACRFEGATTGIRFGLNSESNFAIGNFYTSGMPTKVSDLSKRNFAFEPSQLFKMLINYGRFEAYSPQDVTKGVFLANMAASGQLTFDARVDGDTNPRWYVSSNGRMFYGSGSATPDFNWFRSSSATLQVETGTLDLNGKAKVQGSSNAGLYAGAGTPEAAITAVRGSLFLRNDGGAGTTLYVKETGSGNTGWVAK